MGDTQKINPLFIPFAIIVVVTAISSTGNYIFKQVETGTFPWWPYPALALLIGLVFVIYGFISRKKD